MIVVSWKSIVIIYSMLVSRSCTLCMYVGSHILVNSRYILTLAVAGFPSTILLQYLTDGGIFWWKRYINVVIHTYGGPMTHFWLQA
jgi:hypothetical protein